MARHARTPDALAPLPKEVAKLQAVSAQLSQGQAEARRRLEGLSEGQARQQEQLTEELSGLKSLLHGLSIRLNDGLADELETIDERIVRLAAATQGRERQHRRAMTLALAACTLLALVAGLALGALIVAGSPEAAFDSLRGAVPNFVGGS
jgi:septal ring factor EnvC (AmiA/AmiB activator)